MKQTLPIVLSLILLVGCASMPAYKEGAGGVMAFTVTSLRSASMNTTTKPVSMELDFVTTDASQSFTQTIKFKEGRSLAFSPVLTPGLYQLVEYRVYQSSKQVSLAQDMNYEVQITDGSMTLFPEGVVLFRDLNAKGGFQPFTAGLGRWQPLLDAAASGGGWQLNVPEESE